MRPKRPAPIQSSYNYCVGTGSCAYGTGERFTLSNPPAEVVTLVPFLKANPDCEEIAITFDGGRSLSIRKVIE